MNIIREIQKRWFPKTLKCVYRKDILEYALKYNHNLGVCYALWRSLEHYDIYENIGMIGMYLPLANLHNAKNFKAESIQDGYWWPLGDWSNRTKYLKWLLEQYKDDKTNLKEL